MSTIAEIEAAVAALPAHERELLIRRLTSQPAPPDNARGKLVLDNGRHVMVAPPGAPALTPEFVKDFLADCL
jgi:hypothetical protein